MDQWIVVAVLILSLTILSGCQAFARPTAPPTPTPILLAPTAQAAQTPMPVPTQAPVQAPVTASPTDSLPAPAVTTAPLATQDRIMALGVRLTLAFRAEPRADAAVVAQAPGAQAFWAEGRSTDGKWLWANYGDAGGRGWLPAADARLFGDATGLPVVEITAAPPVPAAASAAGKSTASGRGPAPAARLPGKLAFQTAIGGDIYLVNADGSGLRRLTDGLDPALSPDGTRLAFARWGSPHGVFVLDLRTGEERRVAVANRPRSPTWSPDGGKVAFLHVARTIDCRRTPFGCLSDTEIRARFGGQDCVDSPAGRYCIDDFPLSQSEQIGIAQVGADGQGWLDIAAASDAQALAWHPRRDEGLYRGGGGLQIAVPDGPPRPLVQDLSLGSPAWSPDGQRIVVQAHLHDHTDIFLLDGAGQKLTRLTAPADILARAPNNVAPAWSPDGQSIVFLSDRAGAWQLYRMNADGAGQAPFLPDVLKNISFRYDFAAERVLSWGK